MAQKQYIKHEYEVKGKSLRGIAKDMGLNFRTVQRYAQQENWNLPEDTPLLDPRRYSVVRPHAKTIDKWLEEDQKAPRKQRHTAKRIYARLVHEEGFEGNDSSVRRYVNKKRLAMQEVKEGYLPLAHPCGHAQCDFGEFFKDGTDGRRTKVYALTIIFSHSNHGLTQAFPSQNQECLLKGMKRIFGSSTLNWTIFSRTEIIGSMRKRRQRCPDITQMNSRSKSSRFAAKGKQ